MERSLHFIYNFLKIFACNPCLPTADQYDDCKAYLEKRVQSFDEFIKLGFEASGSRHYYQNVRQNNKQA